MAGSSSSLESASCGLLSFRGVRKAFRHGGRDELVLDGVSLDVGAGEVVAVVGQRWEGKTTLLRLAAGMLLADGGEVCFGGVDFGSCSRGARARLLGREIVWLDRGESGLGLRVLDYVGLPLVMGRGLRRAQARRVAAEALERVGVSHVAGRCSRELSSWEHVLVELACAVVAKPRLLVVDDLLDALGGTRTQQAGDLVRSLVGELGFGVLFAVSDIEAAVMANRVLSFERPGLKVMSDHTPTQTDELAVARATRVVRGGPRTTRAC
jgi:ABC-type nitrate/sulfonate/bicarbonate transport system ATPase subunit